MAMPRIRKITAERDLGYINNYKSMSKNQLVIEVARINRTTVVSDRIPRLAHLYHEIVLRGDK